MSWRHLRGLEGNIGNFYSRKIFRYNNEYCGGIKGRRFLDHGVVYLRKPETLLFDPTSSILQKAEG